MRPVQYKKVLTCAPLSCVQLKVTSDGKKVLPGGLSFPGRLFHLCFPLTNLLYQGTYAVGQTGIVWPPLDGSSPDPANYPLPGGAVWEGSPGGGIYGLDA